MIWKEIKKSLIDYKILNFFILLASVGAFLICHLFFSQFKTVQQINTSLKPTEFMLYENYQCSDNFEGGFLKLIFADMNRLEDLKNFVDDVEEESSFIYSTVYKNAMEISYNSSLPQKCYAYDQNSFGNAASIQNSLSVKAVEINKNAAQLFTLDPVVGTGFTSSDFVYNPNSSFIYVLAGSSYSSTYQVGDQITLEYWGMPFLATIKGILPENAYVIKNNQQFYLDDFLLLPFLNCNGSPATEEERTFQAISYSCRANGNAYLSPNYSAGEFVSRLNNLSKYYGLPKFNLIGQSTAQVEYLNYIADLGYKNVYALFCISIILHTIILLGSQMLIISLNKSLFVHWLQGAKLFHIILFTFLPLVILITMAHVLTAAILSIVYHISYNGLVIGLSLVQVILLCPFILQKVFQKINQSREDCYD